MIRTWISASVCLSLFYLYTPAIADNINGKVTDQNTLNPVPGVNIFNHSNQTGTSTDYQGTFTELNANPNDTITFSHLGYQNKQIIYQGESDLHVQMKPVALDYSGIEIKGFEDHTSLFRSPHSASFISSMELEKYDQQSLQPAISSKPGIRMEERAAGSYRLSVRGSQLRAPFGVRNVKVYWNDIPFTEPGGNTHLNLIDFNLINEIEILRGPAGSTYGAGTGGVLMLYSRPNHKPYSSVTLSSHAGSYGQMAFSKKTELNQEHSRHLLHLSRRKSNGYRDHNAMRRSTAHYTGQFDADESNSFEFMANYTDYFYEIPGALTNEQLQEDRRQSRPNNPFTDYNDASTAQNASIHMENFLLGGSYQYRSENFENQLSTGGQFRSFDHPFNIDYKKSTDQSFQIRNRSTYGFELWNRNFDISWGGEAQKGFRSYRNYGNVRGRPDTLRLDDEISAVNALAFMQTKAYLEHGIEITAGMSLNHQELQINRISEAPDHPEEYKFNIRYDPVLSPRVAVYKHWDNHLAVFGSVSQGFSPPTFEEVRTSEGTINRNLIPEEGINTEAGIRYRNPDYRFNAELTVFSFSLNNTIVSYASPEEVELFRNQGETSQDGIETSLSWQIVESPGNTLSGIGISMNYTYNHFFFEEYITDGEEFSGNRLTGVPPHNAFARLDIKLFDLWEIHLSANAVDQIPLNDENSVYSNEYLKADLKNNFRFTLGDNYVLSIYGGINNLLNQEYSLGNDLNPFGGRYYQPAPERNYFGGIDFSRKF